MVTALQILFALFLIILIIIFVFKPKRIHPVAWPADFQDLLNSYVAFYAALHEDEKTVFEKKFQHFLSSVTITPAGAVVEDLDRVLIGAAATIPVFFIPDWEYVNLREVLLYPGNFNIDFEQQGRNRMISGMVGTGNMQNVMILSKWELRQGFIDGASQRNTAIHEFVHLIDKMDGTLDGVPELLLERRHIPQWQILLQNTMDGIRSGESDIDAYGATSPVECFAVVAEYYFEQPEIFKIKHPLLHQMMHQIFVKK